MTALVGLLAGCALRGPKPGAVRPTSAGELLASLDARRAALTSLRARARLRAGLKGAWTREALLVRRPDALRIDVLTPFGLALAVGARADRLWAYPPSERTRYEGDATATTMSRFLGAPVGVGDVVDILLGVPPARASVGPPRLALTPEGEYRLTLPLDEGVQTIWFAGDSLSVLRAEERRAGEVALRVAFSDYEEGFPHVLDVEAPGRTGGVRLAYDAVEPNASIDPAVFAPPDAPRVLPLEAAGRAVEAPADP